MGKRQPPDHPHAYKGEVSYSGDWVQVSRLGMPLTNEVVIPVGMKDYWNSITPYDEIADQTLDPFSTILNWHCTWMMICLEEQCLHFPNCASSATRLAHLILEMVRTGCLD